ncbi:hypothetical protein XENOCAPTIV_023046, partial [Xenoophorus captivus]
LALRAGNEKEEGETADTVGCCSLRVEHIKLYPKMDEQEYVVEFDFLGKDSIRYYNKIPLFLENKQPEDDLFDRLNNAPSRLIPSFTLCKKWAIPIEKIYNKTQREKFAWAIDMAEKDYEF